MKRLSLAGVLALLAALGILAVSTVAVSADGGFDQYGYNYSARIFNGPSWLWATKTYKTDEAAARTIMGDYANDKLVMKWNAEWDRGKAEGWSKPPYKAWETNEWNGRFPGGSGSVWHYKTIWIGAGHGPDGTVLPDGGYVIWGQFEVVMDQGADLAYGPGHMFFAKATPNGFGQAGQ